MAALLFIVVLAVVFIIGKSIHDSDEEETYHPSGENYWDRKIRENREAKEAMEEALLKASAPDGPYTPPDLPDTVIEYVSIKHSDHQSAEDRKRLEEKLDENIQLQKEILDKMSKQ